MIHRELQLRVQCLSLGVRSFGVRRVEDIVAENVIGLDHHSDAASVKVYVFV